MISAKKHWAGVVFVGLIAAVAIGNHADSQAQANRIRTAAIEICVADGGRAALIAAYKHRTASAQRSLGHEKIADDYEAFARGGARLIIIPESRDSERDHVIDVQSFDPPIGKRIYILTEQAQSLIQQGCKEAYR